MEVYRITPKIYAQDLEGTGARLYGGRWNRKGVPCIYTAESRALAICEYAVHVSLENLPPNLMINTYEISQKSILIIDVNRLPENWRSSPAPFANKDVISKILLESSHPVLCLPSAIIPEEHIYLLNPLSADFKKVKLISSIPYTFDERIFS